MQLKNYRKSVTEACQIVNYKKKIIFLDFVILEFICSLL